MFSSVRVASVTQFRDVVTRVGDEVYSSQQLLQVHGATAAKTQLLVVRNALACVVCAVATNGCFYAGNIFSCRSSTKQTRPEFLLATLLWSSLSFSAIMLVAHLPSLMTQRFLKFLDYRPGVWFCMKKLMKGSSPYFIATLGTMVCLGLLVQHIPLLIQFKLHFYLGDFCNLIFTAGITLTVRRIYYKETQQGRDRSLALKRQITSHLAPQAIARVKKFRTPSFWREYRKKLPDAVLVALAGAYIHAVSFFRILDRGEMAIAVFALSGIIFKLAIQEAAKRYIVNKGVRSIHTMCVLVGVPTVLINTQTRIVLLGTQTNTLLVTGTFGMALAEVCLRAGKAVYIVWTIRRRAKVHGQQYEQFTPASTTSKSRKSSVSPSFAPPIVKLEFETWRRQVLSYHTAELTADMYAEYIAIGCSQSIMFWYVSHPFYPALRLKAGANLSERGIARWRINQIAMLAFQFVVVVIVDYICVVMEMVIGIEFNRVKGLSAFLGVLFMAMAVLTINISATVYLS
ncbi:hypothetical protein PF005_g4188 [Phytophthora fragariae]|uniref:Uncharacterized protein n=2 Tax=Phytophthora fragariae TaxID=53985 RepID=A0A6A3F8V0_9STRA|nr:hypothetical protein PF003_g36197 [Phytophthora fragariae]KAE8942245.1 hypothetical protein PF009_g7992 [Phytophthora fragariae]KAE9008481.1 hypothetical protein PF011_g10691 [Phytophthora fragariae]KAE9106851.1 hypothetical protein PF007_g13252 [Phytophthora fragariae]KAE9152957.1 hypothetical protein PF006_g2874 [Phytophthora fragariae]